MCCFVIRGCRCCCCFFFHWFWNLTPSPGWPGCLWTSCKDAFWRHTREFQSKKKKKSRWSDVKSRTCLSLDECFFGLENDSIDNEELVKWKAHFYQYKLSFIFRFIGFRIRSNEYDIWSSFNSKNDRWLPIILCKCA